MINTIAPAPSWRRGLVAMAIVAIMAVAQSAFADAHQLTNAGTRLVVEDGRVALYRQRQQLVALDRLLFNYQPANSWTLLSADDSSIILEGSFDSSVDFFRPVDDTAARTLRLIISRVNGGYRLYANPQWGRQTTLEFRYLDDHFFGLSEPLQPDNRLSPDLTGGVIDVDVVADPAGLHENYASAFSAFYMSSHGYGAFFDTMARGRYSFAINGKNRIQHETGTLDWYIFPGETGVEIHRAYFQLIGAPKKLPAWALGPVGWRDQNDGGAAEILDDVKKLSDLEIPFTSWFVDRPYSDGAHAWSQMNFSKDFADPGKWIGQLREHYGLEFMTWTSPATFGDPRLPVHLAGNFSYMDLSDPATVEQYRKELTEKQYRYGVRGHKMDRADEHFPVYERWQDHSIPPEERRNRYALLMAQVHDQALRDAWGDDQVTFARAAIHRSQPYLSAIWAGDPRTSWEGLQANYANAARSAFMGFPVWGTDVGGYQGEGYIPENLYLRWMQAGSMSGLFEIKLDGAGGDGRDRMPWQYDEKFQAQFKAICDDRMRFIPYLYSLANNAAESGTLMQPLAYRHLDDPATYDIWDQFYVGDALMVAPVLTAENQRRVYFPEGEWRSLESPANIIRGGRWQQIDAPLDSLPRYQRANSLYVTGTTLKGSSQLWDDAAASLQVHAYPGRVGSASEFVYVDSLDQSGRKTFALSTTRKQLQLTAPALTIPLTVNLLVKGEPKAVLQSGNPIAFDYQADRQQLVVSLPAGEALALTVTR